MIIMFHYICKLLSSGTARLVSNLAAMVMVMGTEDQEPKGNLQTG